jgi:hypothetical protein
MFIWVIVLIGLMQDPDLQRLINVVSTFKFSSQKVTINKKTFVFIIPTMLQNHIAHSRRHPKDKTGWKVLPQLIKDNFEAFSQLVPEKWMIPEESPEYQNFILRQSLSFE